MSNEDNRFTARAARYVRVGSQVGSVAARVAGSRLFGIERDRSKSAAELAAALGGLKGPIMKVAQLLSTIPEALPAEYAAELAQLQSQAPAMGPAFVRRRMIAELGPEWASRFKSFEAEAAASASLGQVHRAVAHDGRQLACKLQYPDMQSAVEADVNQLRVVFSIHARMDPAVDTSEMLQEIATRLREELDYDLEARHTRLYAHIFGDASGAEANAGVRPSGSDIMPDPTLSPVALEPAAPPLVSGPQGLTPPARTANIRVPDIVAELSTKRLLTMSWLEGRKLTDYKPAAIEDRNAIAQAMFRAWWYPFSHYGVIHGDPHLGNYTVFEQGAARDAGADRSGGQGPIARAAGINLLDYGCIRTFPVPFVQGVIDLYNGLLKGDRDLVVHAYETWGFRGLSGELIDAMNIWARFIYGPLLDDRERTIAEGTTPAEYGRREAFSVHKILREKGPVKVPREFVFMDRAAIGLGGVFLHLDARQNWYRLFNETIEGFKLAEVEARQRTAFAAAGVPLPT